MRLYITLSQGSPVSIGVDKNKALWVRVSHYLYPQARNNPPGYQMIQTPISFPPILCHYSMARRRIAVRGNGYLFTSGTPLPKHKPRRQLRLFTRPQLVKNDTALMTPDGPRGTSNNMSSVVGRGRHVSPFRDLQALCLHTPALQSCPSTKPVCIAASALYVSSV